jgi:hypothetical protein
MRALTSSQRLCGSEFTWTLLQSDYIVGSFQIRSKLPDLRLVRTCVSANIDRTVSARLRRTNVDKELHNADQVQLFLMH